MIRRLLASVRSGVVKTFRCRDEVLPFAKLSERFPTPPSRFLRGLLDNPGYDAEGIAEPNGWTTFDLDCDFLDTTEWRKLGSNVNLIYASYCTALRMGELVVVRGNQLERHFLHHDEPDADRVDVGKLAFETNNPLRDWSDVWEFVDDWRWKTLT